MNKLVTDPRLEAACPAERKRYSAPPVGQTAIEADGNTVVLLYNSPKSGLLALGYTPEAARDLAADLGAAADVAERRDTRPLPSAPEGVGDE